MTEFTATENNIHTHHVPYKSWVTPEPKHTHHITLTRPYYKVIGDKGFRDCMPQPENMSETRLLSKGRRLHFPQ
jgi:hypothetical protein